MRRHRPRIGLVPAAPDRDRDAHLRAILRQLPTSPGVYLMKGPDGRVLYVGKADVLRNRVRSYFGSKAGLDSRILRMVGEVANIEYIVTDTVSEAFLLEGNLIKEHRPRFNIRLKDDKSYPFLAVTLDEEWPRAMVMRGKKRKGVRYFGPYGHAYAIRETLDLVLRTFPIRTCSDAKFERHRKQGRPCLLYHIEKCSGPCVGEIDKPAYDGLVDDLFLTIAPKLSSEATLPCWLVKTRTERPLS